MRARLPLLLLAALLLAAGCRTEETRPSHAHRGGAGSNQPADGSSGKYEMSNDAAPLPDQIPADVANTPDAVPKAEPKSASGNPSSYETLGQIYQVLDSAIDFREKGYASWYGRKFHGHRTSSGEVYNMFAMTAAHKTLPLPTYVRVKRVDNGKSVIVKINDRGPFHSERIIDLSYAAAAKLDMISHGQAMVELEAITPGRESAVIAMQSQTQSQPQGWLVAASFGDPINAVALRDELMEDGIAPVEIWTSGGDAAPQQRVVIGPFADEVGAKTTGTKLKARGLTADWVTHE